MRTPQPRHSLALYYVSAEKALSIPSETTFSRLKIIAMGGMELNLFDLEQESGQFIAGE